MTTAMKLEPNFDPKVTEGEIGYLAEILRQMFLSEGPHLSGEWAEPPNVVDALLEIAHAIDRLTDLVDRR